MKCPNDATTLVMSERQGIEIDYCPECRGVWLDRGELDKIIDRAPAGNAPTAPAQPRPEYRDQPHYSSDSHHYRKHKKEGFLGDLFDF
jgi:hypothetical protein